MRSIELLSGSDGKRLDCSAMPEENVKKVAATKLAIESNGRE